jgi:hypothetical protein
MEPTRISSLKPADYNPRKMSRKDAKALRRTIDELGDLSGIIKNVATSNLVGGHQRIKIFTDIGDAEIIITERMSDRPGPAGTTAHGYIIHPTTGEKFAYREVHWPLDSTDSNGQQYSSKEKVANVAANNISGDWDMDKLSKIAYDLQQLDNFDDLNMMSNFDDKDLDKLNDLSGFSPDGEEQPDEIGPDPKEADSRSIKATKEQWETIDEALEYIKSKVPIPSEDNGTKNGSALYYMSRVFLEGVHAAAETEADPKPQSATVNESSIDEPQTSAINPDSLIG